MSTLSLILSLLLVPNSLQAVEALKEARPQVANFIARDMNGREVNLESYKGKVLILAFWATWCAPCKKAMPLFEELAKSDDVALLAISMDDAQTQSRLRGVVRRYRWKMPVLTDADGRLARAMNPKGSAPFTLLLDRQQRLSFSKEGFNMGEAEEWKRRVKALVAEK